VCKARVKSIEIFNNLSRELCFIGRRLDNAEKFVDILICCLSFLTVTHCVIESKTHVGRRNEITGANVGPRHPIFFEGRNRSEGTERCFNILLDTEKST